MQKMFRVILFALVAALLAFSTNSAWAQSTSTGTQSVTADVTSTATLTLGSLTVAFASEDPGTVTTIPQTEGVWDITADARTTTLGAVSLTVAASGDLSDGGGDSIPINAITWAGTGTGYNTTGTLNKTTAQTVGGWTGSGSYAGTMEYSLANSWSYQVGTYTGTLTYTLTCP